MSFDITSEVVKKGCQIVHQKTLYCLLWLFNLFWPFLLVSTYLLMYLKAILTFHVHRAQWSPEDRAGPRLRPKRMCHLQYHRSWSSQELRSTHLLHTHLLTPGIAKSDRKKVLFKQRIHRGGKRSGSRPARSDFKIPEAVSVWHGAKQMKCFWFRRCGFFSVHIMY